MAFTPRLNSDGISGSNWYYSGNKFYQAGYGLPNCFSGDTRILTRFGYNTLKELVAQTILVPTIDNNWRKATVLPFGSGLIYCLVLDSSIYYCTGDHIWLVKLEDSLDLFELSTIELKAGMKIPYSFASSHPGGYATVVSLTCTNEIEDVYCVVEPVTHTFTLWGGEITHNCTAYAYGRYAEIRRNFATNLPGGNATSWYDAATDFQRGTTPALGSIICWSSRSGKHGGHVAVVEQIDSSGNIVTSNSAWNGTYFYLANYSKSSGYYCGYHGGDYYFRGFIYNDAVGTSTGSSVRTRFLEEALKHVGESGSWTYRISGLSSGEHWCAAFVVAVSKTVGILNKIIANSFGAGSIAHLSCENGWGIAIPGPYLGQVPTPQPGDLIQFRWGNNSYPYSWNADHVGIVLRVDGENVIAIEGNRGGNGPLGNTVQQKTYSLSYRCIFQYYRPNWSLVGDSDIFADPTGEFTGQLYDTESTEEDATMREVSYLSSSAKPSIFTTNTRLSVVNYTSGLAALVNSYGGISSTRPGTIDNVDGLPSVPRQIVEYLVNKGLPTSSAIGIIANIERESGFNTSAVGDNGTSFGLCQWHLGRGSAMKQMAGSNWANNLTGQLDYLWYELSTGTNWSGNLSYLKSLPNTEEGARQAADYFVRKFEVPSNVDNESILRQNYASKFWGMIIVNSSSSTIDSGTGGYSEDQINKLWSTISTPDIDTIFQLGSEKGYSSEQIKVALGWTEGEDGGGWYASKGQPYADYLYACIGINWAIKYGAQGFYNRMSAWGSYYAQSNVANRANKASATTRKAMFLALNNLNDKVMYGNGVGSRPATTFYTVHEYSGKVIWFSTG